jgi:hypothetical protein
MWGGGIETLFEQPLFLIRSSIKFIFNAVYFLPYFTFSLFIILLYVNGKL